MPGFTADIAKSHSVRIGLALKALPGMARLAYGVSLTL